MKRIYSLVMVFILLLLVTGCSSDEDTTLETNKESGTLTCVKTEVNDSGYTIEDTLEITYVDDILTKLVEVNIEQMDSSYVDKVIENTAMYVDSFKDVSGYDIIYEKISTDQVKYTITIDYTLIDLDEMREIFGSDYVDESYFSSTSLSINEFKTNYLSDYTCN